MDNTGFNKKLKISATVFALIVIILLGIWFSKERTQGCIDNNNYAEALTFEEAIQVLYDNNNITESPQDYVNFEESISADASYSLDEIQIFKLIDNYRLFLSDEAACNRNGESLISFICRIVSDESFLKSRLSECMNTLSLGDLPTFRFCCEIAPVSSMYGEKKLKIGRVNSWLSLEKDYASYMRSDNNVTIDTYVFTRINGEWQLSLHMY